MRFQYTGWTGKITFVDADSMRDAYIKLGYPREVDNFDAHLWEEEGLVTNRNGDQVGRFTEVDAKRSKWNILEERQAIRIAEVERATRELQNLETITYQPGQLVCSGCGLNFLSEAEFAKHYIIRDERFLNIGECPDKVAE